MRAFITHNLRSLVTPSFIGVMVIYLSFAWFLADPSVDPTAIYSSERFTSNYDLILMSVMMMNFLLFIVLHFKREWKASRRDILASRWTARRLVWGFVVSYAIFYLLAFVIPTYVVALVEQLICAPRNVRSIVFLLKASAGIVGYSLFWIIVSVWCATRLRNEFVSPIVLFFVYAASQFSNLISQGLWFNSYWLASAVRPLVIGPYWQAGLAWLAVTAIGVALGVRLERTILQVQLNEPYRKGMLSRLAQWSGADLAMHHYRMMGLSSQKVLAFFTAAGLLLLVPLFGRTDANLMPLAKVYLGAFVPVLFSFNQYFLIKIDREAGMTHNNFLRTIPYSRIILSRWLLLLAPQLGVELVFILIASALGQPFPFAFILYVLALNILCSAVNLLFAVTTMTNAVANLFLLFLVYLQLRDDVQHFLASSSFLSQLNILGLLVQPDFAPVTTTRWLIVIGSTVIALLLAVYRLGSIQFAELQKQ